MTKGPRRHNETWWWNEEVAEAVREKKIRTESGRKKIRKRQRWSIRRVEKMQRGVSVEQMKRTRRNVQMTPSVKMKFFEWKSRWSKKDRIYM